MPLFRSIFNLVGGYFGRGRNPPVPPPVITRTEYREITPVISGQTYTTLSRHVFSPQSTWVEYFAFARYGDSEGVLIQYKKDPKYGGGLTVLCFYPHTKRSLFESMEAALSKGKWVHEYVYGYPYVIIEDYQQHPANNRYRKSRYRRERLFEQFDVEGTLGEDA